MRSRVNAGALASGLGLTVSVTCPGLPALANDEPRRAPPSRGHRDLHALPKAHLHIHFGAASARRATLADWAQTDAFVARGTAAVAAARAKADAAEDPALVAKYGRRADLVASMAAAAARGDECAAEVAFQNAFGAPPPPLGTSEHEV